MASCLLGGGCQLGLGGYRTVCWSMLVHVGQQGYGAGGCVVRATVLLLLYWVRRRRSEVYRKSAGYEERVGLQW